MLRVGRILFVTALSSVIAVGGISGCTKKPNEEELAKLEQARAAVSRKS